MTDLYCDTEHVVETIRHGADEYDECSIRVLDAGQITINAATEAEMDDRNLWNPLDCVDSIICRIDIEESMIGSLLLAELSFHQSEVETKFELRPARADAIDPRQATSPAALGDRLALALHDIVEEWDPAFTFAEVSAASVAGGGHYTDFEFEYSIDGITR